MLAYLPYVQAGAAVLAFASVVTAFLGPRTSALTLTWAAFCASVFCAMTAKVLGPDMGAVAALVAVFGSASCGWFWLFARALFRPERPIDRHHVALVGLIMAGSAIDLAARAAAGQGVIALEAWQGPLRIVANAQTLLSSTILALSFCEAAHNLKAQGRGERWFRLGFLTAYATAVCVSVIWTRQSGDLSLAGQWKPFVQALCCLAFVGVTAAAVHYRFRHALRAASDPVAMPTTAGPAATAQDRWLAERLKQCVEAHQLHLQPDLRVADLAVRVNEPDHRVSRAITAALGYRNFNQFINHYRIETAKRLLADPDRNHQSVLTVSMESGFGSVGPFNRAFKAMVGMPPREYRTHAQREALDKVASSTGGMTLSPDGASL